MLQGVLPQSVWDKWAQPGVFLGCEDIWGLVCTFGGRSGGDSRPGGPGLELIPAHNGQAAECSLDRSSICHKTDTLRQKTFGADIYIFRYFRVNLNCKSLDNGKQQVDQVVTPTDTWGTCKLHTEGRSLNQEPSCCNQCWSATLNSNS